MEITALPWSCRSHFPRSGFEAVKAVAERKPDLIFLDVQMPGLDGFGVLETVAPERMPVVIFTTAFDDYALKAFEVHALDYLMKPVRAERLLAAAIKAEPSVIFNLDVSTCSISTISIWPSDGLMAIRSTNERGHLR